MTAATVSVEAVTQRLADLRLVRGGAAAAQLCTQVRDLVVLCTSSRSGSSALSELLRRSPDLLTFSAEVNPHFTIPVLGRGPQLLADPEPVCATADGLARVRAELGLDLGQRAPLDEDVNRLADHTAWRLTMQWPSAEIDREMVHQVTRAAIGDLAGRPSSNDARRAFFEALMRRLLPVVEELRWRRYDAAADLPPEPEPAGPHADVVVEMAPFVLPRGWRPATPEQARTLPVVVTAPRNAFRLPLLQAVFPAARLRVLHLTRNPAATVNGLRDGWLHHGFFTIDVGRPLNISGYADASPQWAGWWCFDLPPGWQEWTEQPLVQVCGFQWRAAHRTILDSCAALGLDRHVVPFEALTAGGSAAERVLVELAAWLGIDPQPLLRSDGGRLPTVMSTQAPRPARWRAQEPQLRPVLQRDDTLALAAELGYGVDPDRWV